MFVMSSKNHKFIIVSITLELKFFLVYQLLYVATTRLNEKQMVIFLATTITIAELQLILSWFWSMGVSVQSFPSFYCHE